LQAARMVPFDLWQLFLLGERLLLFPLHRGLVVDVVDDAPAVRLKGHPA
jgi:hypothetical protein